MSSQLPFNHYQVLATTTLICLNLFSIVDTASFQFYSWVTPLKIISILSSER